VGVVEAGFFAVDRLGRAGGLLKVVVGELLVAEVAVGFDRVDVRGATGLVRGRLGGTPALVLVGLVAFSSVRDGNLSAMFATRTKLQNSKCRAKYVQSKR
jgi:hypothetical protein